MEEIKKYEKKVKEKRKEEEKLETLKKEMLLKARQLLNKDKSIKNIFVGGEGGVGKTTLINSYLLDKFSPETEWKWGDFFLKIIFINNKEVALFIWDVMGQERARFLVEFFAKNIDGALFCFDLTRAMTLEKIEDWIKIMRKSNPDLPILFLGSKADLADDMNISKDYIMAYKEQFNLYNYLEVSSKTGKNVKEAFNILIERIKQTPTLKEADINLIKKKFKLYEYLNSFSIKDLDKSELESWYNTDYEVLEEINEDFNNILSFPGCKKAILEFIKKDN